MQANNNLLSKLKFISTPTGELYILIPAELYVVETKTTDKNETKILIKQCNGTQK